MNHLASRQRCSGRIGNALTSVAGCPSGISALLGVPAQLQARRSAAVDRQVRQRPVNGLDRSDRPLGQLGDDHRSQLVDLAVKGQLAPA